MRNYRGALLTRRAVVRTGALGLLGAAASLAGCGGAAPAGGGSSKVVTTIYPLAYLAGRLLGDESRVSCMVPAGTEPHDWEPTPTDVAAIQSASLFVYNGAGLEGWVSDVLSSLGAEAPRSLCATDGVALRTAGSGTTDPHVWLAPSLAVTQAQAIASALEAALPDQKDAIRGNLDALMADLLQLDQDYSARLGACPRKEIVVSHEAFGYLCDAYGLTQVGIEGLSPDSEPDAARMAQLVDEVRSHGVTTIFFEELVSPKTAQAIASETGAQVQELNPLEGLTSDELSAGETYLSVMRDNLAKLEAALS